MLHLRTFSFLRRRGYKIVSRLRRPASPTRFCGGAPGSAARPGGVNVMLSAILLLLGAVLVLVGMILFLIKAFRVSVAWGLGVLLLAPVGLVFLVKNWKESRTSFLLQLGGAVLLVAGFLTAPATLQH